MSRRGRSKDVAISLFSFQDIITSVTAIMILLVLILTLELVTREATKGVATEDRGVARELRRSVHDLERQLEQLRERASAAHEDAQDAIGYSAIETARRLAAAQRTSSDLKRELAQLELQLSRARVSRREAEAGLVAAQASVPGTVAKRVEDLERRASHMEDANERERERQADAEAKSRSATESVRTLVFNAPPGDQLEPVLIEVSQDGIVAAATKDAPTRTFAWGLLGGPSNAFTSWLSRHDPFREYVVIILRPSGVDRYHAVHEAVVKAGLAVGTELIGEEMSLALGTR